jgi:hypothetical protein
MLVYTVTVIDVVGDPILGNRRTPAIFTSIEKALAAVKNNESDLTDDNLYQYAVIEETWLNMIRPDLQVSTKRIWFKYNTVLQEFEQCNLESIPRNLSRLTGFGIG